MGRDRTSTTNTTSPNQLLRRCSMTTTTRSAVFALVLLGLGSPASRAQQPVAFDKLKPLKAQETDDDLRKLLIERYNTALEEVQMATKMYVAGFGERGSPRMLTLGDAIQRLVDSAMEAI